MDSSSTCANLYCCDCIDSASFLWRDRGSQVRAQARGDLSSGYYRYGTVYTEYVPETNKDYSKSYLPNRQISANIGKYNASD